jgi:hypothetical protein
MGGRFRVASFGDGRASQRLAHSEVLLGPPDAHLYNASRGTVRQAAITIVKLVLRLNAWGIVLGTAQSVFSPMLDGLIRADALAALGWNGRLEQGVDDTIWRTLVANRTPERTRAPA